MRLSHQADHVLICANPKAGPRSGRSLVEALVKMLGEDGLHAEIITDVGELSERSHDLMNSGKLRCVVAAGGDGTVAMVANHTPPDTPISILALGTENLLSKHLNLAPDPASVCHTIRHGQPCRFDAGQANGRIFLLMAGCGFDADVVRRLHAERTGNIHHLSYAKPIIDSIRNYEYPELRLTCHTSEAADDPTAVPETISARWAFVVNLPRYAFGLGIAPGADGTDGLLDVCTFQGGSIWNGLRYLSAVVLGQHESWDECVTLRTHRLRIESDGPVPYQLDGDPGGFLPVDIRVLPGRLTLLTPHPLAGKQGARSA